MDLFLKLHILLGLLLDAIVQVIIILDVLLLHVSQVHELSLKALDLSFILNYLIFVLFQLESFFVKLCYLLLELGIHTFNLTNLDLNKLLLRLLFDVHL